MLSNSISPPLLLVLTSACAWHECWLSLIFLCNAKKRNEQLIFPSDQRSRLRSASAHTEIDSFGHEDEQQEAFDPDERRIRVLLKQNLKYFDVDGSIDFEKLTRELRQIDRDQSGLLTRQQIEEVVYKVRIPLQRTLIYQILEKHCKAYLTVYR